MRSRPGSLQYALFMTNPPAMRRKQSLPSAKATGTDCRGKSSLAVEPHPHRVQRSSALRGRATRFSKQQVKNCLIKVRGQTRGSSSAQTPVSVSSACQLFLDLGEKTPELPFLCLLSFFKCRTVQLDASPKKTSRP